MMRRTLEELTAGGATRALAILADEGAPILRRNPARSWSDHSLALDDAGWRLLGQRLGQAVAMATAFGVRTSFHPHIGTHVESPWVRRTPSEKEVADRVAEAKKLPRIVEHGADRGRSPGLVNEVPGSAERPHRGLSLAVPAGARTRKFGGLPGRRSSEGTCSVV
jgi:hypothetical protein